MKSMVRILGRNGVVYEEPMTVEQLARFPHLANLEVKTPLGVAFEEWTIQIGEAGEQTCQEQQAPLSSEERAPQIKTDRPRCPQHEQRLPS